MMKTSILSSVSARARRVIFGLAFSGALAGTALAADAEALARSGGAEITLEDVRPLLDNLSPRDQTALARDPAPLNQLVRSLLVQQLLLKEALASQWDQRPEVAAQLERARQNLIAESYLQSISKPAAGFPTETDLQAAYQANKASLLVPRQLRLAQIYIAVPKNADKEALAAAQAQLDATSKSLKQPNADFASIARTSSDEPASAERGGEIGWLAESQIQPEIRTKITALAKNGVSEPLRLADGWHILKVLDLKEAYTPALEEVRDSLAQQLRAARTRANSEAYLAKLLQQNPVAINEIALAQLLSGAKK
ncbi:MAG TPA: peptidylprolyl isomerase [Chthoniobacterales bacterium]